jgi:hypothetical protein
MMEKKRKEKQKKKHKNFHWTRMCLSLRLGPIDVNWKQSLVDGARESLFVVEVRFASSCSSRKSIRKHIDDHFAGASTLFKPFESSWKLHRTINQRADF